MHLHIKRFLEFQGQVEALEQEYGVVTVAELGVEAWKVWAGELP